MDETVGYELLSFMNEFKGYHQIFMEEEDEENTAFVTHDEVYCYHAMAFMLKNIEATFTQMVAEVFKDLLGNIIEAYVEYILVNSNKTLSHPKYLTQCFKVMKSAIFA